MQWFLERITSPLPVRFGIKERTEHAADFAKLVEKKILKHSSNLDSVDCCFCEELHECQVRNDGGKLSYVCDNGSGKKKLTDADVAIFEYDNDAMLGLLNQELGLVIDAGSHKEKASYSSNTFYRIGLYQDKSKKLKVECYYLRSGDGSEPSIHFAAQGNAPRMLITNTLRADIAGSGKEHLSTCALSDILATDKKSVFSKAAFIECFDPVRRVRFDKKNGHLLLDEKRIYTAPLGSGPYFFLLYLWEKWMQQLPYADIHGFVRGKLGKDVEDTAEKFCQKMKSEIKGKCKKIAEIITIPTIGHYMMADPLQEK